MCLSLFTGSSQSRDSKDLREWNWAFSKRCYLQHADLPGDNQELISHSRIYPLFALQTTSVTYRFYFFCTFCNFVVIFFLSFFINPCSRGQAIVTAIFLLRVRLCIIMEIMLKKCSPYWFWGCFSVTDNNRS